MLHIGDLLDRKPQTLSGGERQRSALARALAIQPRLMFLDEPLGTLDPVTRERVAGELQNCHRWFGMTTVHVTHDHSEARMMGDAVGVILRGKLQQAGPTDEVFRRPKTAELAGFLGCENVFEAEALPGDSPAAARVQLGGVTFAAESDKRGEAVLCVRPEDVLVEPVGGDSGRGRVPGGPDTAAAFGGRLVELSQRGPMVRLVVDADGHHWVILVSHSQQRNYRFCEGDSVRLRIPADALHLIPGE